MTYRLDRREPFPSVHSAGFMSQLLHAELTAPQADEAAWELEKLPQVMTPGAVLLVRCEQTGEVLRVVLNTQGILK